MYCQDMSRVSYSGCRSFSCTAIITDVMCQYNLTEPRLVLISDLSFFRLLANSRQESPVNPAV